MRPLLDHESHRPALPGGDVRTLAGHQLQPVRVPCWRFLLTAGPFTDSCIHLRDLAEPQGLDVTAPLEDWRDALDVIVSPRGRESFVPTRGLLDGLCWEASDTDWTHGEGSIVTGSAEAFAMVMSGRPAYLDRLSGEGAAVVRVRLGA